MSEASLKIGLVGVGVMGTAIATRLLERGHELTVRDADPAKLAPLVARGARAAGTGADLAREVDYVVASLNTADIVERVVFGPDGVAAGAGSGKLLIDMSSIDPKATAIMATRLEAETGMAWVDAPLSGGAPAALEGRLTLMLGGSVTAAERARAVLTELATNITHMGPSGAGQTTKLINQVLCACNFLAVAEATRLALDGEVDARKRPSGARRRSCRFPHPAGVHAEDGGASTTRRPAASTTCSRTSRRCNATPWRCGRRCRSPASSPSCTGSWSPPASAPKTVPPA